MARDKQGSPTLRCISSTERPLYAIRFMRPYILMPIAWQSRAAFPRCPRVFWAYYLALNGSVQVLQMSLFAAAVHC